MIPMKLHVNKVVVFVNFALLPHMTKHQHLLPVLCTKSNILLLFDFCSEISLRSLLVDLLFLLVEQASKLIAYNYKCQT